MSFLHDHTIQRIALYVKFNAIYCTFIASFMMLSGCATTTSAVYKLYPGENKPKSEIVILELYDASNVVIDGLNVSHGDYTAVHLLPGSHHLTWTSVHGVSVMIEPSMYAHKDSKHEITLEKGHTYRLRSDRTTGPGYRIYNWIEDITSGSIVAGEKKP
jgi:FlaA1/EpsC-like NDP-sugar epimerase